MTQNLVGCIRFLCASFSREAVYQSPFQKLYYRLDNTAYVALPGIVNNKGINNALAKWYSFLFNHNLREMNLLVRLSLLTMTNSNQLCDVLLFVCSKMADETNLSSKLPVADTTREV